MQRKTAIFEEPNLPRRRWTKKKRVQHFSFHFFFGVESPHHHRLEKPTNRMQRKATVLRRSRFTWSMDRKIEIVGYTVGFCFDVHEKGRWTRCASRAVGRAFWSASCGCRSSSCARWPASRCARPANWAPSPSAPSPSWSSIESLWKWDAFHWWHRRDDSFTYNKTCQMRPIAVECRDSKTPTYSHHLSPVDIILDTRKVYGTISAVVPDFAEPPSTGHDVPAAYISHFSLRRRCFSLSMMSADRLCRPWFIDGRFPPKIQKKNGRSIRDRVSVRVLEYTTKKNLYQCRFFFIITIFFGFHFQASLRTWPWMR